MKAKMLGLLALVMPVAALAQSAGITAEERAQAEANIQNAGRYLGHDLGGD